MMEIILSILLVVLLLALFYFVHKRIIDEKFRKKTASSKTDDPVFVSADELLKELGVEIKQTDGKGAYLVGYQGGVFSFLFNENAVRVYFSGFYETSYTDSIKANVVANGMNVRFSVWNCYLLTNDSQPKPVKVNLSCTVPLAEKSGPLAHYLREIMQLAFHIAREFRDEFDKMDNEMEGVDSVLMDKEFRQKMSLVRNKLVTCDVDENGVLNERPACARFTLDEVIDLYPREQLGVLRSVSELKGTQMENWEDINAIANFDVIDYLRVSPEQTPLDHVLFRLCFENAEIHVTLVRVEGSTPKTLFYEMTVNIIALNHYLMLPHEAELARRTLIEVRLTTDNEDYWEAKYMIDEANDFLKENPNKSITSENRIILGMVHPNLQQDMYWGQKFYIDKCYMQSILHFKRVMAYYRDNWHAVNDREKKIYYRVCYNIGFIYMEQNDYEKAFYYLYKARDSEQLLDLQGFINCLCNMRDPEVVPYLQSWIDRMIEMQKREDADVEVYQPFYLFLLRRMAYALINQHLFDQAEVLLYRMIEKGENVDFAKKELEHLKRLKNDNNEAK